MCVCVCLFDILDISLSILLCKSVYSSNSLLSHFLFSYSILFFSSFQHKSREQESVIFLQRERERERKIEKEKIPLQYPSLGFRDGWVKPPKKLTNPNECKKLHFICTLFLCFNFLCIFLSVEAKY